MSDDHKYPTGIRCHGRSGGKSDFVGGKPDNYRHLQACPRPSLMQRIKALFGLGTIPRGMWTGLKENDLARIVDDAETEAWG